MMDCRKPLLRCLLLLLTTHSVEATTRVVSVPGASRTYGLDGPWNALSIQVGAYWPNFETANTLLMDVFPGGYLNTYLPTKAFCGQNPNCGAGGRFDPLIPPEDGGLRISFTPSSYNDGNDHVYMNGTVYAQTMNFLAAFGDQRTINAIPNSSIIGVDNGQYVTTDGRSSSSIELGYLTLGGDVPSSYSGVNTWNPSSYYANVSITASNSFGLHIGSALFNYGPVMNYGGYDRGRTIGPVVTFGSSAPFLQDIVIGVETGSSPFAFDAQTGLLRDNSSATGANNAIPVFPDPRGPYLSLPKQTCDRIASLLPVTFDNSSGLYLWNKDDPLHNKIVSSPAYLGFVFPPAGGSTASTTIKVPFPLLNLTLSSTISGKESDLPYFPCQPYVPRAPLQSGFYPTSGTYPLGRAFLQAAFVGRNWGTGTSWIAQAPGPGGSGQGLGQEITQIAAKDTMIDTHHEDGIFKTSWEAHWTPLAMKQSKNNSATDAPVATANTTTNIDDSAHDGSLSTGAEIGIGAGSGIAGLLAIAGLVVFLFKKRLSFRKARAESNSDGQDRPPPFETLVISRPFQDFSKVSGYSEAPSCANPQELKYDANRWTDARIPHELPTMVTPVELSCDTARGPTS